MRELTITIVGADLGTCLSDLDTNSSLPCWAVNDGVNRPGRVAADPGGSIDPDL